MRSDIALQLYSPSASLGKIAAQFFYFKTLKQEIDFADLKRGVPHQRELQNRRYILIKPTRVHNSP